MKSWEAVLRGTGVVTISGLAAALSATVVSSRIHDPIDVVGRPLIDGYSERAESAQWLLFLLGTALLSCWLIRRRLPTAAVSTAAALATVPLLLALWHGTWLGLILYWTIALGTFLARRSNSASGSSFGRPRIRG